MGNTKSAKREHRQASGSLFRNFLRRIISPRNAKATPEKSLAVTPNSRTTKPLHRGCTYKLQVNTLEDICRLGGVGIFILPKEYSPCALALPTCLAATGSYIAHNWFRYPGIFRIPGSANTVNALYGFYTDQIYLGQRKRDQVEMIVRSTMLPGYIAAEIHDAASVFKKFIALLPGGILGSIWVFQALSNVESHPLVKECSSEDDARKARALVIAYAIASVDTNARASLICAVFGLLSCIGSEGEALEHQDGHCLLRSSESMGFHALSVVFGPLLLGDLTSDVELTFEDCPRNELALQLEAIRATVQVTEMVLRHWTDVARELRHMGIQGKTWDIPWFNLGKSDKV